MSTMSQTSMSTISPHILAHCCTIFLKSSGYRNIDDRHRNPNNNTREIIWLGNQLLKHKPPFVDNTHPSWKTIMMMLMMMTPRLKRKQSVTVSPHRAPHHGSVPPRMNGRAKRDTRALQLLHAVAPNQMAAPYHTMVLPHIALHQGTVT